MTTDPRPIDLSDDALFAGLEPAAPPPPSPEGTTAAVATALRVMRAANLKVAFGVDMDDTERLWTVKLSAYSAAAIIQASNVWIDTGSPEFPTLAEFETVVRSQQNHIDHPPRPDREPGAACPGCGATEEEPTAGYALAQPDEGGTRTVRPCEECNPDRYEAWRRNWPRKAKRKAAA